MAIFDAQKNYLSNRLFCMSRPYVYEDLASSYYIV
jgi:hypothetical protein